MPRTRNPYPADFRDQIVALHRAGRSIREPEIDEEQMKELHAKIGELAVANDFLARKLKPWGVT